MDLPSKLPTPKPDMRPSRTALSNILPRVSITKTNNRGDNRSSCFKPLELPKKPQREPLIKMEKRTVDRQKRIYCLHLVEKPLLSNICIRKFQFTWSRKPSQHPVYKSTLAPQTSIYRQDIH